MKEIQYPINISAPDLVNVCVDGSCDGEVAGRLYHCYRKEELCFSNLVQLLRMMEKFFDEIQFPQASTKSRSFFSPETGEKTQKTKLAAQSDIILRRGKKATFIIVVQFRQNATWQGDLFWVEKEEKQTFSSTLDLIKIFDGNLTVAAMETDNKTIPDEYAVGK